MLIIASGHCPDRPFACALSFNGPVGVKEALYLLMRRRNLYRDWIETIALVHEGRVFRYWSLANKDWTS